MRNKSSLVTVIILVISGHTFADSAYQNWPYPEGPYLGQDPPGMTTVLFAPDVISTGGSETNSAFNLKGSEFYFTTWTEETGTRIMVTRQLEGRWAIPQLASFSTHPTDVDPVISYDGKQVFFSNRRPRPGEAPDGKKGFDMWFAERLDADWGEAQFLGPVVNSGSSQAYTSLTSDGTLYFQSVRDDGYGKADIYRSRLSNGLYQAPENLGPTINSEHYEGDVFVAADESYLVVTVYGREDGFGGGDLYVSFRGPDDSWSPLKNMGSDINSDKREFCPMVTHDGKYLFFSSKRRSAGDIFWVDSQVIENLRVD